MDDVISSLDDLTPELMTCILRKVNSDISVETVRVTRSKRLPYSTVARLKLAYAGDRGSIPNELFLKIIQHETVDPVVGAADAEIEFYKSVAPLMPSPPIVRCIDAATSPDAGHSHLLLADLVDSHYQSAENQAPEYSDSLRAVSTLARCHARWWNDDVLGNGVGSVMSRAEVAEFVGNLEANVAGFLDVFDSEMSHDQRSAYRLMLGSASEIWGRITERRGLTLTHGDCHWWNFLFPRNDADDVYIIDWHLWHVDLGARDLAFLLALGGFAEPRPEIEIELLRRYYDTLIENDVINYSFDDLMRDYRWSAIRNLNIPVIFWSQGKHESTITTALRRAYESFERLDCRELIA